MGIKSSIFLSARKLVRIKTQSNIKSKQPLDFPVVREKMAIFNKLVGVLQPMRTDVDLQEDVLGGINCWHINGPKKVILYLHGGGYVFGINHLSNYYRYFLAELSKTSEVEVWAPEYRLAPEHPYPAAIEDAYAAYLELLAKGHKAKDIFVMGDSAGGGLSLALLLKLRDEGKPLPKASVVLSPWTDLAGKSESMTKRAHLDPMLLASSLPPTVTCIVKKNSIKNPYISPVYGNYKGLPPMMILVGGREILFDDSIRVAKKARNEGVDVTLDIIENMIHVYPVFGGIFREGKDAMNRIVGFMNKH